MVRWLVVGVIGAALIAAAGVFALYPLCCEDDDDPSTSASVTPTPTSPLVVTPTPTPSGDPGIEYSLKVIDWADRLRIASLAIAEKIALYGTDITATDDLAKRDEMYAAFDQIADVRAEYNSTTPPPGREAVHQRLGESLAMFADAGQSVTLGYVGWDQGEQEATALQFNDAADSMNNAISALNEVIGIITDPDANP